jgi:hypothetical protein
MDDPIASVGHGLFVGAASSPEAVAWQGPLLTFVAGPPGSCSSPVASVPVLDLPASDLISTLPGAVDFLDGALAGGGGRALVTCAHGHSRAPATAAAYLLWRRGRGRSGHVDGAGSAGSAGSADWGAAAAVAAVRAARPAVSINPGFLWQLSVWAACVGEGAGPAAAAPQPLGPSPDALARLFALAAARHALGLPVAGFDLAPSSPGLFVSGEAAPVPRYCAARNTAPPFAGTTTPPSLAFHCGKCGSVLFTDANLVRGRQQQRPLPPLLLVEPLAWHARGPATAPAPARGKRWASYAALPSPEEAAALVESADGCGRLVCPHSGCGHKVGSWAWAPSEEALRRGTGGGAGGGGDGDGDGDGDGAFYPPAGFAFPHFSVTTDRVVVRGGGDGT